MKDDESPDRPAVAVPAEFRGAGRRTLRGLSFGEGERWAVLVHDTGQDLDCWRRLAVWLAGYGLCVLTFDLPGHGASDDPWGAALATPAVTAAAEFATSQGARQVHLVGAGVGAIAALAAATNGRSEIASTTLLSPRLDDRVAALSELREARASKLILVGSHHQDALEDAETVFRAAIGHCEMDRLPVVAQGTDLLAGEWGQQVREKVLMHLSRQR